MRTLWLSSSSSFGFGRHIQPQDFLCSACPHQCSCSSQSKSSEPNPTSDPARYSPSLLRWGPTRTCSQCLTCGTAMSFGRIKKRGQFLCVRAPLLFQPQLTIKNLGYPMSSAFCFRPSMTHQHFSASLRLVSGGAIWTVLQVCCIVSIYCVGHQIFFERWAFKWLKWGCVSTLAFAKAT